MPKNTEDLSPKMKTMLRELIKNQLKGEKNIKPSWFGHQTTWRNLSKRGFLIETSEEWPIEGVVTELGMSILSD